MDFGNYNGIYGNIASLASSSAAIYNPYITWSNNTITWPTEDNTKDNTEKSYRLFKRHKLLQINRL